ncbi:hypothetical protein [Roseovarius nanhaiticus]|uniref:hypothetical protein n=1 Tax=Roseovarius nanhaiticus TaxID=573024 RepID=UPI002493BACD|nr:hypothetical protein [Roseovarius nanhaiticus]
MSDADGVLVWDPGVEWTGGDFASTFGNLARWGHALFGGEAMEKPYIDRPLDGSLWRPARPAVSTAQWSRYTRMRPSDPSTAAAAGV